MLTLIVMMAATAGCASRWKVDGLRDPRATALDERLRTRPELMANPFEPQGEPAS